MDISKIENKRYTGIKKINEKDKDEKLKKACKDFEAIFLDKMFEEMRKSNPGDGIFGNSFQRDTYESMYFKELASKMSEKSTGIGEAMYRQVSGKMKYNKEQS